MFPHDYRSGPANADWDLPKWVTFALSKFGVVWGLCRAIPEDIATARPRHNVAHVSERVDEDDEWMGPTWVEKELKSGFERNRGCIPGDRRKRC